MPTDTPIYPWNPADFLRPWLGLPAVAPQALVQPILPGWTLNINSQNSSAPQTEVDVVARHSYGRQIGRIADALRALIVERHGDSPHATAYADFLSMWRDVEDVKLHSAEARIAQIEADLDRLERDAPEQYERLRAALVAALSRRGERPR
jgi:hypothetical protein